MKREQKKRIPIYDMLIDPENGDFGISAISFVNDPAIQRNFVMLNNQHLIAKDNYKQILTSPVLIPNQVIYRNNGGDHYIRFSADEIEKASFEMMKRGLALNNTTHQHQIPLTGNYLVELWIIRDSQKDKAAALGFNLPVGTLMASYKIEDTNYWNNEILTGNVKGFSLEGFFKPKFYIEMEKKQKQTPFLLKLSRLFLSADELKNLGIEDKKDETESGTPVLVFILENGEEIFVDKDGNATFGLNGEVVPDGSHKLNDGMVIVIKDGKLEVTEEKTETTDEEKVEQINLARINGAIYLQNIKIKNAQTQQPTKVATHKELPKDTTLAGGMNRILMSKHLK